jgi:spore coat polysaccharide biosynthesis predicted glycosyltransferase SpsG
MARADFAVTAAGSIVFELVCLGTPQIAFIIDRNQEMMEALLFMVRLKKTGKLRLC